MMPFYGVRCLYPSSRIFCKRISISDEYTQHSSCMYSCFQKGWVVVDGHVLHTFVGNDHAGVCFWGVAFIEHSVRFWTDGDL